VPKNKRQRKHGRKKPAEVQQQAVRMPMPETSKTPKTEDVKENISSNPFTQMNLKSSVYYRPKKQS